jgi:hypothetical protein
MFEVRGRCRPIVRNKANFLTVAARIETGEGRRDRTGNGPAAGAYRAKRSRCPATPGGTGPQGRGMRGKCAKRTQFGPAWAGGRRAKDAKRTQFGSAPREGRSPGAKSAERSQWPPMPGGTGPQGRGTRGNRAKQSQFLRSGTKYKCFGEKDLWLICHAQDLSKTKPISPP